MTFNTNTIAIRLSAEQVYEYRAWRDRRYRRRVQEVIETPPTEQQWADYRKAKEAHEYLMQSPYFQDGGPDDGSSVNEPTPDREYIYAETTEEWIQRCQELDKEQA